MKTLAVCFVLLIVIVGAVVLVRRPSGEGQEPERATATVSESIRAGTDHAANEMPSTPHVVALTPTSMPDVHNEAVAPIADGTQVVTNGFHAKNEVTMNASKQRETIPASDEKRRLISIAFDRAKDVMEIKDASTATVEYTENIAVVTFPFPRPKIGDRPSYPGPDYLARVKIDRSNGNILEILGAP